MYVDRIKIFWLEWTTEWKKFTCRLAITSGVTAGIYWGKKHIKQKLWMKVEHADSHKFSAHILRFPR
jgi:hypothetical protein